MSIESSHAGGSESGCERLRAAAPPGGSRKGRSVFDISRIFQRRVALRPSRSERSCDPLGDTSRRPGCKGAEFLVLGRSPIRRLRSAAPLKPLRADCGAGDSPIRRLRSAAPLKLRAAR